MIRPGSAPPWDEAWWASAALEAFEAWRGVEAQHIVATMRLVDSTEEQAILEDLLEDSKPALPPGADSRHFLAFTPFRYRSPFPSRFRRAHEPGIWYGADTIETACTELAWWGHRLLTDSEGLVDEQLLTEFTVFPAAVDGVTIDLGRPPWSALEALWIDEDYGPCQALADDARERPIAIIRYPSVRHVAGRCCAVLDVGAIMSVGVTRMQTWYRRVTREASTMTHPPTGQSIAVSH